MPRIRITARRVWISLASAVVLLFAVQPIAAEMDVESELAEMLELEKPSLGRLLDRLEAKGWVRREVDARDRRAKRVFLTGAMETPMRVMREIAAGVREDALSGLSIADRDRFVDTLLTIKSNLMDQVNGASKANEQGGR